jgi:hypothetical protein
MTASTPTPGQSRSHQSSSDTPEGFVIGSVGKFDRVDALENAVRDCLGLPPLP